MAGRWRIGMTALCIGLVASLAWGFSNLTARRQAETILSARYQQNFFEALGHIENVEILLSKALVSASPRESIRYLTELWQQAASAQASLNALPLRQGTLMRTSRFLTQLGDFSFVASQKMADGRPIGDEDWESLRRLHSEVASLGLELNTVAQQSASGRMPWEEVRQRTNINLNPFSKQVRGPEQLDDFARIEQQMQEMPTMIYDGPFSDHMMSRTPKGIKGESVDPATAQNIGLSFVPIAEANRNTYVAEQVAETGKGAPIAAWTVQVRQTNNPSTLYVLDVSQEGGHVLWFLNSRTVGKATYSLDDATRKAQDFLEARGFRNFTSTYPIVDGGRAIIPFALSQGEVILYPDQVKVTVALDTGEIIGFEALQYYMAHHDRTLPTPKLTPDEAKAKVSGDLTVESVRLALIPRADVKEVLTYEVIGKHGANLYHVYINALTGDEEQILRIVESEETGRLAI